MHATGVDVKSGSIFCAECNDFIYDAEMDNICLSTVVSAEEKQTKFQGLPELNE
jgi:ubiquitin carboxyl-terminal hydrolase 22/27/51